MDSGVDTIEHASLLDEASATRMAEKGLYLVPTLLGAYFKQQGEADELLKKRMEQLRKMGVNVPSPEERIALAKRCGVKILVGTDCGGNTAALFGSHGIELYMLAKSGLSNMEAIVAATGGAAEAMGLSEEVGIVRPGFAADLLVVDGNPLEDISVLAPFNSQVETVIKDGQIVHSRGE